MLLDRSDPMLEALDPLVELLVGELEERPRLAELPIKVLTVLGVAPVDVRLETLGEEPDVLAQVFDEHTGVIDLLSKVGADAGDLLLKARPRVGDLLSEVRPGGGDLLPEPLGGRGDQPLNLSE